MRKKLLREDPTKTKELFVEVLSKSGPLAVVVTKRRGHKSIQVPIIFGGKRRVAVTSKWI